MGIDAHIAGTSLITAFGLFGCIVNTIMIAIYLSEKQFRNKSYYLLLLLAVADFVTSAGYIVVPSLLLHTMTTNTFGETIQNLCGGAMFIPIFGVTFSQTVDFLIACDRLFSASFPVFYTLKLGTKYVLFLLTVAIVKCSIQSGLDLVGEGRARMPLCSIEDIRVRNCYFHVGLIFDMVLTLLTVLLYGIAGCVMR